jgi:hypothetical protein
LDEESRQKLLAMAVYLTEQDGEQFCHHLTIAYKPDSATWQKFSDLLGKTVQLVVVGIACDEKGQAVYIPSFRSEKEYPHVTVSCAEGVKPVYSNTLLAQSAANDSIKPLAMLLGGTVQFVTP